MRCTECARSIARDAIVLADEPYCCLGCLAGGPCVCDTAASAEAPLVALEIGPFASQADLMHLAALLGGRPGIDAVDLVLADVRQARFSLRATSIERVAESVAAIPGYDASVSISGDRVRTVISTQAPASPAEELLPPLPRIPQRPRCPRCPRRDRRPRHRRGRAPPIVQRPASPATRPMIAATPRAGRGARDR